MDLMDPSLHGGFLLTNYETSGKSPYLALCACLICKMGMLLHGDALKHKAVTK